MTERLTSLLHDEADTVDIPAPPAAAVLAEGHRIRRRQRLTTGAAAIAVLGVVAGGVAAVQSLNDGPDTGRDVPTANELAPGPVFAVGTTVYLDGGKTKATVDDKAIKSLYYTSAGVLVRHGNNPNSDGGGPMRFSLVRDDGSVQPLDVTFEETVPSTDPTQPYLAYAQVTDGTVEVVVLDVTNETEVARVAVPGNLSWGGWRAPPVALDGDHVYVGADDVMRVVDWRTGQVEETTTVPAGYPDIQAGRSVQSDANELTVVDVATGDVLLTIPTKADAFATLQLSPDGRYAALSDMDAMMMGGPDVPIEVYDVDTGSKVSLDEAFMYSGWSPGDQPFGVEGKTLTICDPATGECTPSQLTFDVDPNEVKLGGRTYES
jgi:hypothetical protein